MDNKNLMPQQAQPVNRITTGQQQAELMELSEEALSLGRWGELSEEALSNAIFQPYRGLELGRWGELSEEALSLRALATPYMLAGKCFCSHDVEDAE